MATSTYMTFLMHKKQSTWEKLLDITEFPDLGGDPELLETTTLSDKMQTYVNGVQSNDGMTFNANYDHTEYKALKALEGKNEEYAVWFGGTETARVSQSPELGHTDLQLSVRPKITCAMD